MYIDIFLKEKNIIAHAYENKANSVELNNTRKMSIGLRSFFDILGALSLYFRIGDDTVYFSRRDLLDNNREYDFKLIYKTYMSTIKKEYPNFVII